MIFSSIKWADVGGGVLSTGNCLPQPHSGRGCKGAGDRGSCLFPNLGRPGQWQGLGGHGRHLKDWPSGSPGGRCFFWDRTLVWAVLWSRKVTSRAERGFGCTSP